MAQYQLVLDRYVVNDSISINSSHLAAIYLSLAVRHQLPRQQMAFRFHERSLLRENLGAEQMLIESNSCKRIFSADQLPQFVIP